MDRIRLKKLMTTAGKAREGNLVHLVTLVCNDSAHAQRCLEALRQYGKPDAHAYNCVPFAYGLKEGSPDTVYLSLNVGVDGRISMPCCVTKWFPPCPFTTPS